MYILADGTTVSVALPHRISEDGVFDISLSLPRRQQAFVQACEIGPLLLAAEALEHLLVDAVFRGHGALEAGSRDRFAREEPHPRTALHLQLFEDHSFAVGEAVHSEEALIRESDLATDLLRADVLVEVELAEVHQVAGVAELIDHGGLEPRNERHHEALQPLGFEDSLLGSDDEAHRLAPVAVPVGDVVDVAAVHHDDGRVPLESFANLREFVHLLISLRSLIHAFGYAWMW